MLRRIGKWALIGVVLLGLTAELVARLALGLGDPPLYARHAEMEYVLKPGCYQRFGNRLCINRLGMRSDAEKPEILVIGDSVINGGSLTDQDDLATEILGDALGRSVGNVSAGSWGPENWQAFLDAHDWPEAEAVVVVMTSGDLIDIRDFPEDLGPDYPFETPLLALEEVVFRYLPRYILPSKPPITVTDERRRLGAEAYRLFLMGLQEHYPRIAVLYHPNREEHERGAYGSDVVRTIAEDLGIPVFPSLALLQQAHYRDHIHLTRDGQRLYADLLLEILAEIGVSPR